MKSAAAATRRRATRASGPRLRLSLAPATASAHLDHEPVERCLQVKILEAELVAQHRRNLVARAVLLQHLVRHLLQAQRGFPEALEIGTRSDDDVTGNAGLEVEPQHAADGARPGALAAAGGISDERLY